MTIHLVFGRLFSVKKDRGYLRGMSKLALAPLSPRCCLFVVVSWLVFASVLFLSALRTDFLS